MKINKRKNGKGYVTSYTMSLGCKESRELNFIDENGDSKELEKIIDIKNGTILIKLKEI